MKLAAFLLLLLSFSSNTKAQNNSASDCSNILKIAALANTDQLKTLGGLAFTSKYFKPMFGGKLYASKINIAAVAESFIDDDPNDGTSYHAFIKDYGTDAAAALADFDLLTKKYEACFKGCKVIYEDEGTVYMYFKKCKIELQAYEHTGTNTWVCKIMLRHDDQKTE